MVKSALMSGLENTSKVCVSQTFKDNVPWYSLCWTECAFLAPNVNVMDHNSCSLKERLCCFYLEFRNKEM